MEVVHLHRVLSSDKGTFGVLVYKQKPLCVTCEDPWNNNKQDISCIPYGEYDVGPHSGTQYQNVWVVKNVPGRSAILIHWGNTIKDTQGCILVGEYFTDFSGNPGIANSRFTVDKLRKILPKEFKLVIMD